MQIAPFFPNSDESAARTNFSMPGLTYMAMPLGAIRIGYLLPRDHGLASLPVKDDEFHITLPAKNNAGRWMLDPLDEKLRAERGVEVKPGADAMHAEEGKPPMKLRSIPVRVLVNDPSLVVSSRLEAFDTQTKRPACVSTAAGKARRTNQAGAAEEVACVGCDACAYAKQDHVRCKFFGRIHVQIVGQYSTLGTYVLRSTSYNTLRTFEAKL